MNSIFHVKFLTSLSLGLMVVACAPPPEPESIESVQSPSGKQPSEQDILLARAAAKELGDALKGALVPAMKSGGPTEAIQVCNHAAPVIADSVSEARGMDVGRTSLRVRNPDNKADKWEEAQLLAFSDAIDDGADPTTLEYAEIIEGGETDTFRYMKPIMLGEVCAACHGAEISPELREELELRYPEDQATGFKPGELRGAFTISKPIPK